MHTKGKWITCWYRGEAKSKVLFVKVEGGRGICKMIPTGDQEANARLIAAAPKLLEACKAARDYLSTSSKLDWDNIITPQLDAAIAEAEKGG